LALLVAVLPAEANKKKDLVKQAEQAVQQNRLEDAEKFYCEAAENGKDKKLQAKCDEYHAQTAAQREQDQTAIRQALIAANAYHDYDKAIALLKSVKTSDLLPIAKHHIEETIPQLQRADEDRRRQAEKAKADQEARAREQQKAAAKALQDGIDAYNNSNFVMARARLAEGRAANPAKVQEYFKLMDDYDAAFNAGWAFERKRHPKEALASYRKAQRIKRDGPYQVAARIANVEQIIAAETAKEQQAAAPVAPPKEDALAASITEFYAGNYLAAESKLQAYSGGSDTRQALAHFYVGASKLTRYLLAGSPAGEKHLYEEALSEFRHARRVEGFSPPADFVSPKIIKVFQQVAP
jgi:hypothetical protein